jgi:rhodanese-related sulfurtransferase
MSEEYTPTQVASLLGDENVQLIDVRAPHEHEAGHIPGSRLIELGELAGMADTIDRTRPVVLYCLSGGRSAIASRTLQQAGFDAHNMLGGMLEWAAADLPMEPADGYVAKP